MKDYCEEIKRYWSINTPENEDEQYNSYPTQELKLYLMLLASCANSIEHFKTGDEYHGNANYRLVQDLENDSRFLDCFDLSQDDEYFYMAYREIEIPSDPKDRERSTKFNWRIKLEAVEQVNKLMNLIRVSNLDYSRLFEFKSSCGLSDFYEYL